MTRIAARAPACTRQSDWLVDDLDANVKDPIGALSWQRGRPVRRRNGFAPWSGQQQPRHMGKKYVVVRLQRQLSQFFKNYELCEQLCACQFKVTVAQRYALMLFLRENLISMNELSQATGQANSRMTRMVDQLMEKALVFRAPDPENRRVV